MAKPGSKYTPKPLTARYALLQDYNEACSMLKALEKAGSTTAAECQFIRMRISEMEMQLKESEKDTRIILERFRDNNRVYVFAMLRFFVGYKMGDIGKMFNISDDVVRCTLERAFRKIFSAEE